MKLCCLGLAFVVQLFRQRDSAKSKGEAALAAGEAGAAAQHFSKAVGVTHDMAFQFIKVARLLSIIPRLSLTRIFLQGLSLTRS